MKPTLFLSIVFIFLLAISCNQGKNWEQVKQENTLAAYQAFLDNNPETEFKDSAILFMKQLDWQKIKNDSLPLLLDSFKIRYPDDSIYTDSIKRIRTALDWKLALKQHTIEAYEAFLKKHSSTSYKYSAKHKIEEIKWSLVKSSKNKKEVLAFLSDYTLTDYLDSLDLKLDLVDFKGYKAQFEGTEKDATGNITEKIVLNFHPNGRVTGTIEGDQEGQNYYNSWSYDVRGKYDKDGFSDLESRFMGMSDETDSEPDENWMELSMEFYNLETSLLKDNREYKLEEISIIEEE